MKRKKRRYGAADDSMFLERIAAGTLLVDCEAARAWSAVEGVPRFELRQYVMGRHRNYLSVRCYLDGCRKQIAMHRLVWIVANGRMIPDGYDIDHVNHDTRDNRIGNLQLRPSGNNQHPHTRGQAYAGEETF